MSVLIDLDEWNTAYPVGSPVFYRTASGAELPTTTKSAARSLGENRCIVAIAGIKCEVDITALRRRQPYNSSITEDEFRMLLELAMCCDPWPITNKPDSVKLLDALLDREASTRGYVGWIEAYHAKP